MAAKAMGMTVIDLLADDGALGRRVKSEFKAPMSKAKYLEGLREMRSDRTYTE